MLPLRRHDRALREVYMWLWMAMELHRAGAQQPQTTPAPRSTAATTLPPARQSPTVGTLRKLPGGRYTMGSPPREGHADEAQHSVTLSSFWIMEQELTRAMWQKGVGSPTPSAFPTCGDSCPIEKISWCDAVIFANNLSKLEGRTPVAYTVPTGMTAGMDKATCNTLSRDVTLNLSAPGYRLPTEAEWEYAARGGENHPYSGSATPDEVAWYEGTSKQSPQPGCTKARNGYGLCDMSGNVWEWVWDWYRDYPTTEEAPNPIGPPSGTGRIFRGGSWGDQADWLRVTMREALDAGDRGNGLGFRLAASLAPGE